MMSFTRKTIYIFIFAAAALVLGACSAPVEKLNQDGNEAFAEQAYMEALELYQSAQVESPELAEPYFNAANTYYRQGDFPAALEQMQMALQYIDEETLAESSYYNLGNTLFNTQELDTAVEAYTQSLLLNPDGQDAKYNLELALQQQEQEQQQQEQEQQQEQNQDQNEDSQDQSQEQGGEGQDSENQENADPQDGENQEENNEDQEGDQSQNNDQQERDQESEQQNNSGEPQEGDNQPDQQPSQTPQPGQRMTEEQARQLLAALSDDMQTLQEKLGQYLFARQQPPAQDW